MSRVLLCLMVLASLGGAVVTCAQETKAAEETVVKTSLAKEASQEKCCFGASDINYRTALGVPLSYLTGLGLEIHEARKDADPVALAIAATSLAVAEKVSGKTAEITATDVMQDAVKLAKLRNIPEELTAVAELSSDEATKGELVEMAAASSEARTEALAASDADETRKDIYNGIQVTNHSHDCVIVYVNGMRLAEVHQGQTVAIPYHDHNHHHHLEAYCEHGHQLVNCRDVAGHNHWVYWDIHD